MRHSEFNALLPWYANKTLDEKERERVEAHLAGCKECAQELESIATIQQAMVDINNEVEPSPRLSFERALDRIEEHELEKVATNQARGRSLQQRLGDFFRGWWTPTPLWPRAIIAVQAVLVVALAGTVVYVQQRDNPYTTSSAPSGNRSSTRIVVSFNDNASESKMNEAIRAVGGRVVDGPSALGLYTIQVPIPPERSAEIQGVLDTLRKDNQVIRFAELKP